MLETGKGMGSPKTRDPWHADSTEDFDHPDWKPLMAAVGRKAVGEFMWMGRVSGKEWSIELYKHRHTRRYVNLDHEGNAYLYRDSRYQPTTLERALSRAMRGL